MQKLVMFNGPPRAGKDTAGEICQGMLEDDMTAVKFTMDSTPRGRNCKGLLLMKPSDW